MKDVKKIVKLLEIIVQCLIVLGASRPYIMKMIDDYREGENDT